MAAVLNYKKASQEYTNNYTVYAFHSFTAHTHTGTKFYINKE